MYWIEEVGPKAKVKEQIFQKKKKFIIIIKNINFFKIKKKKKREHNLSQRNFVGKSA